MRIALSAFGLSVFLVGLSEAAVGQSVAPISDVIEAFKSEIRDAQARGSADCPLRIVDVNFRFIAAQTTVFDGNVGKEVRVLGVALGGKLGGTQEENARSIIDISLTPDPNAEDRLADVSGKIPGLADLILHTKEQIALAAESDPRLSVKRVKIQTDVVVKREGETTFSLAIVEAGAKISEEMTHRLVLTLLSPEPDKC